jgi:hypothetical protein
MVVTYSFGQPLAVLSRKSTVGLHQRTESQISVFPNPSSGLFTIVYNGRDPLEVNLYTLTGSKVHCEKGLLTGAVIDITHLPRGSYIIGVSSGQERVNKWIQKL